jgi:two-component system sensor histidine kinase KdpD
MGTICDEAERMIRLIDNLLQMTRLSNSKIAVNKQWHLLEEVVGSALHRLERQLSGREVRIEIPEAFPLCRFDDVLIEQLIINLLDNAVKYSREGTPIAIRAEKLTDAVMIEVADRGDGFAPGDEVRAFEMFFRGSQGDSRRRGSGLGLAICRAIINAHGGSIHAANRTGGGAVVRFTLPLDAQPPQVRAELEAEPESELEPETEPDAKQKSATAES